ncbi:MAG: MarR family transcriptional regulator [Bacteroidia bacterium]|nr:MarR family transcriptional regulator [Bacteroidia bacterium]
MNKQGSMAKKSLAGDVKKSVGRHPFGDPEDQTGFVMWQLGMLWQRKIKSGLDTIGITYAQFLLLASLDFLSTQKNLVSQQDIAKHCRIDKMMTSKILRILQKKGLIQRRKNKMDSRAKTLALSESGVEVVGKAYKIIGKTDDDFLSPLGLNSMNFTADIRSLLLANS